MPAQRTSTERSPYRTETGKAGKATFESVVGPASEPSGRGTYRLRDRHGLQGWISTVERDTLRSALLDRKSALLQRSQSTMRAKEIARQAKAEVEKQVEAFNKQFLAPLEALMSRINHTILSEPEAALGFEIGSRRIEQRAITGQNVPEFVRRLAPQLVHSEGQMAALAVSMLTAASLTFNWSRWPALIMDDPLQNSDVVHAAGFTDMLSNLVLSRGYQVLVSTHGAGQADFMRRKFRAAAIPCTTVHLVGRGARGVDSRITYEGFNPSLGVDENPKESA